tara:strand:+ start:30 stop:323 length:294 start_codon:yes stop_codon:yes gene_type:complete
MLGQGGRGRRYLGAPVMRPPRLRVPSAERMVNEDRAKEVLIMKKGFEAGGMYINKTGGEEGEVVRVQVPLDVERRIATFLTSEDMMRRLHGLPPKRR